MKGLDLNELLSASMKNAANYKSEAPTWFMPSQHIFNMQDSMLMFNLLASQMMQYAIFHGKTVHKYSVYLPSNQYNLSNLDDLIKHIKNEDRSLKLIFRSEFFVFFVSNDHALCFDSNADKLEVASFTGTKFLSLKDSLKSIGKR